jgi:hypothetical protein
MGRALKTPDGRRSLVTMMRSFKAAMTRGTKRGIAFHRKALENSASATVRSAFNEILSRYQRLRDIERTFGFRAAMNLDDPLVKKMLKSKYGDGSSIIDPARLKAAESYRQSQLRPCASARSEASRT